MLWTCDDDRTILSSINYVHLPIEDFLKEEEMFFLNKFKICSPFPSFCLYLSKKWLTISRRDMFPVTSQDFARVFLGPKLASVGSLLLSIIGTILAQALVWWFPVLIDVAGSWSGEIMNGESDLRYSNKRQLEAEEDSGTNSDLTEKHSSDVRQIPMVRNTSRYFLCFKCKSPARTNRLVTNSRSLQRNVWKTLKRNMKIPSAVLLQNLWNVLHLSFHILILRCVLNDYRFNFIDWFVCRYRQTILCLWQSEHRSLVLYAVG